MIETKIPILNLKYSEDELVSGQNRRSKYGSLAEKLIEMLKSHKLYQEGLKYRGFSVDRMNDVIRKGTDRDNYSEIWNNFLDGKTDITKIVPIERILYAVKEGDGSLVKPGNWSDLEEAVAYSLSRANESEESGISVYAEKDLVPTIPSRECLGEYCLMENATPLAIIELSKREEKKLSDGYSKSIADNIENNRR